MNKFLFGGLLSLCLFACAGPTDKPSDSAETAVDSTSTPAEMPQSEYADAKYTEMGKNSSAKFVSGDVDGWLADYADNAVYYWSAGDSLAGKEAIANYWKDRFANVIESLKFSDQILLPIKVNKPQANEATGTWLLNWYNVEAKYKTGKTVNFAAHSLYHFNANDKIDQTILYIDRVPIAAAMAK